MQFLQAIGNFIVDGADWLWDIVKWVLIGGGVLLTIYLGVPQLKIRDAFKIVFPGKAGKKVNKKGYSSWKIIATTIGGQVGSGNIVGPATAIISGGPGALFWVWVSAIFGQALIFAEAVAAVMTRKKALDGSYIGGPGEYIKAAIPGGLGKVLGTLFLVFLIIGSGLGSTLNNTNAVAEAFNYSFGVPNIVIGVIFVVLTLLVVVGGLTRISDTMTKLVPVMSITYVVLAFVILIANISYFPEVIKGIFVAAFTPKAVLGGAVGTAVMQAMRYGLARGVLSNEAGAGTTPMAHANAEVKHPADQGLASMVSIVIDSLIILTASGLCILLTNAQNQGLEGVSVMVYAFGSVFGTRWGHIIVDVILVVFCWTTIVTTYYYGISGMKQLIGDKKIYRVIYTVIHAGLIITGALVSSEVAWCFIDFCFAIMICINLIGLVAYLPKIKRAWNEYVKGGDKIDSTLNDIRHAEAELKADS